MDRFSVRNGYQSLEKSEWRDSTRMRIWQVFAKQFIIGKDGHAFNVVEDLLSYFGKQYKWSNSPFDHRENVQTLQRYICSEAKWYVVSDFIEYVLNNDSKNASGFSKQFNDILDDEKTGYHIIAGVVAPITNKAEIVTIDEAYQKSPAHVAESINKALKHFSDFEHPDYNNTIKEMITAVEALCCTIVEGEEQTLGAAINKLADHGVVLNDYLAEAIKKLYKYTCNEDGVRHGGVDYTDVPMEDAKFMIVTCSAIINYLVAKWGKTV